MLDKHNFCHRNSVVDFWMWPDLLFNGGLSQLTDLIIRWNNPITGLDRPWGFQEFEALRFQDSRHMKVARLSALRTGTHFCQRLSRPQGHSVARRNMSMKNSNDTIGDRIRDLPACSAMLQPTAPPRTLTYRPITTVISITKCAQRFINCHE